MLTQPAILRGEMSNVWLIDRKSKKLILYCITKVKRSILNVDEKRSHTFDYPIRNKKTHVDSRLDTSTHVSIIGRI